MGGITREGLLQLVRYDQETGAFWAITPRRGVRGGRPLGHVDANGYRRIGIKGRRYLAHRLAWLYVTGEWPALDVDHRNLLRDDNRWDNLRLATDSENHANTRAPKSNTSGLKGAHWNRFRGYWQSSITVQGRSLFLGRFETKEEAHAAYAAAAASIYGEFGRAT